MAIITIGTIDKKLHFIILVTIVRTINLVVSNKVSSEYFNVILWSLEEEIGSVIVGLIMVFIFKPKQEKRDENKKSFKYLIILFALRMVKSCYERIYKYVLPDTKYRYNAILCTINGFEIFLMSLVTFILLKYKYYIHHMISMVIFCAFGICLDFVLGNFKIIEYDYLYIYVIYIINDVIVFCFLKYMTDKLYYNYSEVLLIWGIIGVIVKFIIFSGMAIYEDSIGKEDGILNGIKTYFETTNVAIIIFLQILYFLADGGIYYLVTILMLYYLRPTHMIITDQINVYLEIFFFLERENKYYSILIFVLQMSALLFYYEFLEFNFWNLNKNTAKNIQKRIEEEAAGRSSVNSEIELGDQYYLNNSKTKSSDGANDSSDNIRLNRYGDETDEKKEENLKEDLIIDLGLSGNI